MINSNSVTGQGIGVFIETTLEFALDEIIIPAIASGLPCRSCQSVKENLAAIFIDFSSQYDRLYCQYRSFLNWTVENIFVAHGNQTEPDTANYRFLRPGFRDGGSTCRPMGNDCLCRCTKKVKITAVRRTEYPDLVKRYENPIEHACEVCIGQPWLARFSRSRKDGRGRALRARPCPRRAPRSRAAGPCGR